MVCAGWRRVGHVEPKQFVPERYAIRVFLTSKSNLITRFVSRVVARLPCDNPLMIRSIMTKQFFLRQPSEDAGVADAGVVRDFVDTLEAHRSTCVGMAANMIGERKRVIAGPC